MPSTLREINLEQGMPYVDAAIRRLTAELHQSVRMGVVVLKIIHGYGSSGTGGKIRTEARSYLTRLKLRRDIQDFIPGENFSIFDAPTRAAFLKCDDLRRDRDLERHNNGVTFILL
ncbi:MAG: Smr/MutS family protein [Oscillospiraceae bacterium]